MRNHRKAVLKRHKYCHICGLPIPKDITRDTHPLFGTVDHVIPRSKRALLPGAVDVASNRKAAHFMCNQHKGDREEMTPAFRRKRFDGALSSLLHHGYQLSAYEVNAALKRVGILEPYRQSKRAFEERKAMKRMAKRAYRMTGALGRWEDDGGNWQCQAKY